MSNDSFNLIALVIFLLAVVHTLLASKIHAYAKKVERKQQALGRKHTFSVEILRFLGEVEVIFGLWLIPLMLAMTLFFDWKTAIQYVESVSFVEPMFVVVIMTLASTKPIVSLAENCLRRVAKLGGMSVKAWWWTILSLGPLLGSLITEPAAMTLCAVLLGKYFYRLKPTPSFAYATLGLLFTNISVGGVLTNFAAPPVLIVSHTWQWSTSYMFSYFGVKAILGILCANLLYYVVYRSQFAKLQETQNAFLQTSGDEKAAVIPFWITLTHLGFLAWVVWHGEHPVIFIGAFLFFLGFSRATQPFQGPLYLKEPILVGFFLAALVLHASLQGWWISPLLSEASHELLMVLAIGLSAFNDNAAVTFLASLIPSFDDSLRYAVVSGAVAGGGLTVIANAPNPAGQALLYKYFPDGFSSYQLFKFALLPTSIMAAFFYFLRGLSVYQV